MKDYLVTIVSIALAVVIGITASGYLSFPAPDLGARQGTHNVFTGGVTSATTSVATSTTATVARNLDRQYLYLMNSDANDVWCNLGTATATAEIGIRLQASQANSYEIDSDNLYRGAITCISETAASVVNYVEK